VEINSTELASHQRYKQRILMWSMSILSVQNKLLVLLLTRKLHEKPSFDPLYILFWAGWRLFADVVFHSLSSKMRTFWEFLWDDYLVYFKTASSFNSMVAKKQGSRTMYPDLIWNPNTKLPVQHLFNSFAIICSFWFHFLKQFLVTAL
jgi:hypothetical protein